jgi:peroxiredoxin
MAGAAGGAAGRAPGAGSAVSGLIAAGTRAPDFAAEASDGRAYTLPGLLAEGRVLLAFYPGNDTPG